MTTQMGHLHLFGCSALRVAELGLSKKHEELIKKLENWMLRQEPLVIDDFLGHWIEGFPSKMALLERVLPDTTEGISPTNNDGM
jgi:hypothetical protein